MKQTKLLMGMPISVEIVDSNSDNFAFNKVYDYFQYIDNIFSTYKKDSEISRINEGKLSSNDYSLDLKTVLTLCEKTKKETDGFFNIKKRDKIDPSGLVKGWAIYNASLILKELGYKNFYIEAGGDIQVGGKNKKGENWKIGIRNPFNRDEIVKSVKIDTEGVATSGTYIRGQHIYDPFRPNSEITEIVSLTVIGPNIYEADRFATAAFAMGNKGIYFIERLKNFEAYMIDNMGVATYTSGFKQYISQ